MTRLLRSHYSFRGENLIAGVRAAYQIYMQQFYFTETVLTNGYQLCSTNLMKKANMKMYV